MIARTARLTALLLLTLPTAALAQVGNEGLMWRAGDPFVFCRYGLDKKVKAWFPVRPYTGQFMITPGYCPGPVPSCGNYGKGWNQDEIASFFVMQKICPTPRKSGRWQGPGNGTKAPFKH